MSLPTNYNDSDYDVKVTTKSLSKQITVPKVNTVLNFKLQTWNLKLLVVRGLMFMVRGFKLDEDFRLLARLRSTTSNFKLGTSNLNSVPETGDTATTTRSNN